MTQRENLSTRFSGQFKLSVLANISFTLVPTFFGHELLLRVVDEKGQVVQERLVSADAEKVHSWALPFSREGKYRLILMPKEGKGGSARIGKTLFVVPKEVAIEAGLER